MHTDKESVEFRYNQLTGGEDAFVSKDDLVMVERNGEWGLLWLTDAHHDYFICGINVPIWYE